MIKFTTRVCSELGFFWNPDRLSNSYYFPFPRNMNKDWTIKFGPEYWSKMDWSSAVWCSHQRMSFFTTTESPGSESPPIRLDFLDKGNSITSHVASSDWRGFKWQPYPKGDWLLCGQQNCSVVHCPQIASSWLSTQIEFSLHIFPSLICHPLAMLISTK